jgi:antitoxin (DNA-binding transcriptional repressor) of toxin-antitoxin stability system
MQPQRSEATTVTESSRRPPQHDLQGQPIIPADDSWVDVFAEKVGHGDDTARSANSVCLGFNKRLVTLPIVQKEGSQPKIVTMTDLGQRAGRMVEDIEGGVPAFITKHGRFVGIILPVDPIAFEQALLSYATNSATWRQYGLGATRSHAIAIDELAATTEPSELSQVAARLGLEDPTAELAT